MNSWKCGDYIENVKVGQKHLYLNNGDKDKKPGVHYSFTMVKDKCKYGVIISKKFEGERLITHLELISILYGEE